LIFTLYHRQAFKEIRGIKIIKGFCHRVLLTAFAMFDYPILYLLYFSMSSRASRKTAYRSSVTGRFVRGNYAKNHKRTTEKERIRIGK